MDSPILKFYSKNPPKFYGFYTFIEPGYPITLTGAFLENVALENYDLSGIADLAHFLVYENKGMVSPFTLSKKKWRIIIDHSTTSVDTCAEGISDASRCRSAIAETSRMLVGYVYDEEMKQMKSLMKEEFVHILRRQSNGFA